MKSHISGRRRQKQSGSAFVEFALCFALFWLPLFLGTIQIGFNLIREVEVTYLCRDAGHLYSQRVDFTQSTSQQLLSSLAPGNFTISSTGNTVVIFTTITYVDSNACAGAGVSTANCTNLGQMVMTQQVVVGASSQHSSAFGTPASSICTAANQYVIAPKDYVTNPTAVVHNVPITLTDWTQKIYAAETFVMSSEFGFWRSTGVGDYAQSFF